ncbi:MAG: MBL fold metallo-hydrolase [Bacteroidota bacterium]|nr:MBL fold metallo-hydrolase [Bacteroidota bacterium]
MKLHTVNTGFFKLDGGAMFGVVPKSLWNKINPADENNLCSWAMRCLLIEDGKNLILIDNGIGKKQDEKFLSHYYLHGDDTLNNSLKKLGFAPEDITHNIITHLHFDHCGGGIKWNDDKSGYISAFPNATFYVSKEQWDLAQNPNAREKASFLKENILPMQQSSKLELLPPQGNITDSISYRSVYGHTEGMIIPFVSFGMQTLVYMADLLPSYTHIPTPWVMAYDTQPLISMQEKHDFLQESADNNYFLFLEHDHKVECCTVKHTEKGVRVHEMFSLAEMV